MGNRFLYTIMFIVVSLIANAQVELKTKKIGSIQQKQEERTNSDKKGHGGRGGVIIERIKNLKADRVELYSNVIKRFGRWEGYGKPISLDYASHLRHYYKLTFIGNSKHPNRMQAYDGYHQLTNDHTIGTYLVDQTSDKDKDADSIWIDKLKNVAQWDFVYNEKGDISIERAYDTNGELVYSFYPVKIGNRVAGTFTDAWGMPAKLRKTGGAQVVYVSYDKNGFESLHEFYDEDGFRQKNRDGAYMSRMTNRTDGLILTKASCNIVGQRMIDIFGNCGMQAEYDKEGNQLYDINMDDKWNPVRVKSGNDPFYYNMIKRKYEYDKYKRVVKISFVDLNNKPDTNSVGIHSQNITYSDRGRVTSFSNRDLKGNLCTNPYNGMSRWENEFDKDGRIVCLKNYGDSTILSKGNYKEMYWTYDKKGNEISHLYIDFNGDSISGICYAKESYGLRKLSPNDVRPNDYVEIRKFLNSNQIVKIEYDTKGNQTLWEYSDLKGNAIAPYGYWRDITTYDYYGDSLIIQTECYLDSLGNLIQMKDKNWAIRRDVNKYKEGKHITGDVFLYNVDSTFYNGWRNIYDGEGHKIGEAALNKYGNISRTGRALYHHCSIEYDIKGTKIASYVAYDEFNEPAYFEEEEGVSHYQNYSNGNHVYYDEYGNQIDDMEAFTDSLPAVMSISIMDSVAYKNGLLDGDIILKYGDWCTSLDMQNKESYNKFYFKLIEFADREKDIYILRHEPNKKRSIILKKSLPVGTIQELGFFPQLIYYTAQERLRHEKTLNEFLKEKGLTSLGSNMTSDETHRIYICKPNRIKGYIPTFGDAAPHHYNPSVVLSMAKYVKRDSIIVADKYWNLGMGTDTLANILTSEDVSTYYISVSTNLKDSHDGFPYYSNAHEWGLVDVNNEQYARIMGINDNFIRRRGDSFNPAFRSTGKITTKRKNHKISPAEFFNRLKKKPEVVYTPHALGFINNDSLRLPKCFKDMELIYIGKAQCSNLCSEIEASVQLIDTVGYIRLPNFYSEDFAIAKAINSHLYSEIFLIYFAKNDIRIINQKGLFSLDDLIAIQKTYGKKDAVSLFEINDSISQMPLIVTRTEQDGLARQADIEGSYVMLEYNDWNMHKGLEGISETIESGKNREKRVVLMKIHWNRDNSFGYFDSPQTYFFAEGVLGMRIMDWNVTQSLYDRAASAYEKFKFENKRK